MSSTTQQRGSKAMQKRAARKCPVANALDFALCTVQQGADKQFWYVGEMKTRTGGVTKSWKKMDFPSFSEEEIVALCTSESEQLAQITEGLLIDNREMCFSEEVRAGLMSVEEDKVALAAVLATGNKPSVQVRLAKEKRAREARLAAGKNTDGSVKKVKTAVIKADTKKVKTVAKKAKIASAVVEAQQKIVEQLKLQAAQLQME